MGNKEAINEQRKSIVEQIISDMQNHGFDWVRPCSRTRRQPCGTWPDDGPLGLMWGTIPNNHPEQ